MTAPTWILNQDGDLCLEGYDIKILNDPHPSIGFTLQVFGNKYSYLLLQSALEDGEKHARRLEAQLP